MRTASTAVLDGSIAKLGNQHALGLKAINCRTGDLLVEEQVTAAGKEEVLNALAQAASRLRTRLVQSLVWHCRRCPTDFVIDWAPYVQLVLYCSSNI
jgi:hypothetical protein